MMTQRTEGKNTPPNQIKNKIHNMLRTITPKRLFRRSTQQAAPQIQQPQNNDDSNSIQDFDVTIDSNVLARIPQYQQTQYAEIDNNPINPSTLTTDSAFVQNQLEKNLNSQIKQYSDISRLTHPESYYIKLHYATKIQENEIPLRVSSMIQDLERAHNQTKNSLPTKFKKDTERKIDLVSRTTSQQVAQLVLGYEQSVIGDNASNSLFSKEQKERLVKTAFPE